MNAIVVIIDQFTKMIHLKTTTNISSEGIAKIYQDNIWKLHGIPRKILSATVCIEIHGGIHKSTGNEKTTINSILPSNRWSNQKNQSRDRNVFMILCELPTRWLDKLASCSRIPIQWQEICSNRMDSIQIELWKTSLERRPCGPVSGAVHTGVEVRRMDSKMSRLVEWP